VEDDLYGFDIGCHYDEFADPSVEGFGGFVRAGLNVSEVLWLKRSDFSTIHRVQVNAGMLAVTGYRGGFAEYGFMRRGEGESATYPFLSCL